MSQPFPFVVEDFEKKLRSTPHLPAMIFQHLDPSTLSKARVVSPDWKEFVDQRTPLWSTVDYMKAAEEGREDICSLIIGNSKEKNPAGVRGQTPLHVAAGEGHLEICRLIISNLEDKQNPADNTGQTPLHLAAWEGHQEICRLIISNIDNKNPADNNGWTPLHMTAQ